MIKSWHAFSITLVLLAAGFVWTTFYPNAPYQTFSAGAGGALAAYLVKRSYGRKLENECDAKKVID